MKQVLYLREQGALHPPLDVPIFTAFGVITPRELVHLEVKDGKTHATMRVTNGDTSSIPMVEFIPRD